MKPLALAPLLGVLLLAAEPAVAQEGGTKISGNLELWSYASRLQRVGDSPFNPANRVAALPDALWTAEARLNLRLRHGASEVVLRPRLVQIHASGASESDRHEAYLSQGFVRQRLGDHWTLTAGRELLSWGPGNFRSPSHPIYFDAGKTNPLRDVSGVDLARVGYTRGDFSATLARVFNDGHLPEAPVPQAMTLAKFDLRGDSSQFSLVVASPVNEAPFVGAYAQLTVDDAWLLYGEIGSGRRAAHLLANPGPGWPFVATTPAPRQTTALLGASYTLENGQTLALEWLHDGHGYRKHEARAIYAQVDALSAAYLAAPSGPLAVLQLRAIGQTLGQAPTLLGRDYLALQWQSNPQEGEQFWRLGWIANLSDGGQQLSAYYERNLAARWSVFASATANLGPADSEARRLIGNSLTMGFKFFAF